MLQARRSEAGRTQLADSHSGALKQSSADQLREAVFHSALAMAVTDLKGSIVSVNPAFCVLTGYSEQELVSRSIGLLTHSLHEKHVRIGLDRRARQSADGFVVMDQRLLTKRKKTVWVRGCSFEEVDGTGKPLRLIHIFEDFTGARNTEQLARGLAARLLEMRDQERARIARALHAKMSLSLAALVKGLVELKEGFSKLDPESRERLEDGIALAQESELEVRSISYLLHPPLLGRLGLVQAIAEYIGGFTRRSGIEVRLHISKSLADPGDGIATTLFRIVQEGLNNVRQHSGSKGAIVRLRRRADRVVLEIEDFGRGMPMCAGSGVEQVPGVGIAGMRARLSAIGGTLAIRSGKLGTLLCAEVPLNRGKENVV